MAKNEVDMWNFEGKFNELEGTNLYINFNGMVNLIYELNEFDFGIEKLKDGTNRYYFSAKTTENWDIMFDKKDIIDVNGWSEIEDIDNVYIQILMKNGTELQISADKVA